ncbi:hypothetical protein GCM10027294_43580 [Marinactinospora endophytica]
MSLSLDVDLLEAERRRPVPPPPDPYPAGPTRWLAEDQAAQKRHATKKES